MLRDKLLKPQPIPFVKVHLPAIDATVWVRGFSVRERNEYDKSLTDDKGQRDPVKAEQWRERAVVATACESTVDEPQSVDDLALLFREEDIPQLTAQRSDIVEPLVDAAIKLIGGKVTEDAVKNSPTTDGDS